MGAALASASCGTTCKNCVNKGFVVDVFEKDPPQRYEYGQDQALGSSVSPLSPGRAAKLQGTAPPQTMSSYPTGPNADQGVNASLSTTATMSSKDGATIMEASTKDSARSTRSASGSQGAPTVDNSSVGGTEVSTSTTGTDVVGAQHVVKTFVRTMVKGQPLQVLSVNGGTAECLVSLDRKLNNLYLQKAGKPDSKKRAIPLETIEHIVVGEDVQAGVQLPVTAMCVTLILLDGQALAISFDEVEPRDTFALCLSMFVDGRRSEVDRKKNKQR